MRSRQGACVCVFFGAVAPHGMCKLGQGESAAEALELCNAESCGRIARHNDRQAKRASGYKPSHPLAGRTYNTRLLGGCTRGEGTM